MEPLEPPESPTPPPAARRRRIPVIAIVAVVLGLVAVGGFAFLAYRHSSGGGSATGAQKPAAPQAAKKGRNAAFDPSRPTPVIAAAAGTADVNIYLNGLGTITPLRTVTVRS